MVLGVRAGCLHRCSLQQHLLGRIPQPGGRGCIEQVIDVDNTDELREMRTKKVPVMPTAEERFAHEQMHRPLRAWHST